MRRRDESAFQAFVVERQTMLRRRAFLLCGNWADGDELVQEALARVYVAWPRIATGAPSVTTTVSPATTKPLDLPEKQRAVIVLRFWEDLTVPQISECTGVAEGTIKSQISRALHALRDRLAEPPRGGAEVVT